MTPEEWLEKNTFRCERIEARISPSACASYRKGRKALNARDTVIPLQCQRCPGPPAADPLPARRREWRTQGRNT